MRLRNSSIEVSFDFGEVLNESENVSMKLFLPPLRADPRTTAYMTKFAPATSAMKMSPPIMALSVSIEILQNIHKFLPIGQVGIRAAVCEALIVQDAEPARLARREGGARNIVDHHAFGRVAFTRNLHGDLERSGHRLAIRRNGVDIHDRIEKVAQPERRQHPVGVGRICICKDQVAGRQRSDYVP